METGILVLATRKTIVGIVLDHYAAHPERPFARIWRSRRPVENVTYGELVQRASGMARGLAAAGVGPGDVVVVIVRPGAELLSAWLAPSLVGAIPSLFPWPTEKLDRGYYERTVATLLGISNARHLLTEDDLLPTLTGLTHDAPNLRGILTLEACSPSAEVLVPPARTLDDPEAVAILQHSSGSTGLQKGIALSSRAVLRQIESYGQLLRVTSADRVANWMPLYHDGGLVAGFLQPLLLGLQLSILSPMDWVTDPVLLLRAISEDHATLCWLPNFAYGFMASRIRDKQLAGIDLSSMRAFVNTAEPVRVASHQRFLARFGKLGLNPLALTTSYGAAENTLAISQSDPTKPVRVDVVDRLVLTRDGRAVPTAPGSAPLELLSSGHPLPNTEIRILDPDGRDLPDRHVGEIALRSDCMLTEYYRRPDLTAAALRDGWYLTGDAGYLSDGEIFVTGRKRDLIIVAGNNIYPQDLEFIADHVPGVHPGRTVAFGVENPDLGTDEVVLVVEAEPEADPVTVEAAVREAVATQSDCAPRAVKVVPPMWLLKTSSGKISRTRCRDKYLATLTAPAAPVDR